MGSCVGGEEMGGVFGWGVKPGLRVAGGRTWLGYKSGNSCRRLPVPSEHAAVRETFGATASQSIDGTKAISALTRLV